MEEKTKTAGTDFNPRSPHGERRPAEWRTPMIYKFQSTLPARGATEMKLPNSSADLFQSTLPARGATRKRGSSAAASTFQSTLPARGATTGRRTIQPGERISIHAPRTGSDTERNTQLTALNDFNPRSPHGERPSGSSSPMPNSLFQSTLPARGATKWKYVYTYSEKISIHAPRTGSDYQPILLIPQMLPFQSTLPARGATNTYGAISYYVIFQSTLPARGATMPLSIISRQDLQISIHAPRTGSDIRC